MVGNMVRNVFLFYFTNSQKLGTILLKLYIFHSIESENDYPLINLRCLIVYCSRFSVFAKSGGEAYLLGAAITKKNIPANTEVRIVVSIISRNSYSNAVILNPSFSLVLARFLLTITTPLLSVRCSALRVYK